MSYLESETLILLGMREYPIVGYGNVWCMAVSSDSTNIALGFELGKIAILDAKVLSVVRKIEAHDYAVNAIAFSPDCSRLASTSDDGMLRVWDAHSCGPLVEPVAEYKDEFCSVTFSPDGKSIIGGNWKGRVKMWSTESGDSISELWKAGGPVLFLAYTHDSNNIVAASANETYREYFKADETVILPPPSEVRYLGIGFDGARVCRSVKQAAIQVWDARVLTRTTGHSDVVSSVSFSPDGKRIVSGSGDRSVRVWDADTGKPVRMARMQHSDWVWFVTFSPDGKHIASGSGDNVIRIWDAATGQAVQTLDGHCQIVCCTYSPDGTRIVAGLRDSTLCSWDMARRFQIGGPMTGHGDWISSVAFSTDGSLIASASNDNTVRLWDGHTGESVGAPLSGHTSCVASVCFSPNGSLLASGSVDCTVRLWDIRTRRSAGYPLEGRTAVIASVIFSPDGSRIFFAGWDGAIRCWDVSSHNLVGNPLIRRTGDIQSLAISPDGTHIISGSEDNIIRVWDPADFFLDVDYTFVSCGVRTADKLPVQIPRDGWIRTAKDELLLWVPGRHRGSVCDVSRLHISREENERPVRIVWDKACRSMDWLAIRDASPC